VAEATVLIPAFNEEATVGRVVRVAREAGFPVVVADDGSKDETARRALEAGADVKLLYLVPGLGVVAFQAGEGLVGLVRFSAP